MAEDMVRASLILEGGGMKGIYTAGVLDAFLKKGLMFDTIYGVSAGACALVNYVARQKERTRRIWVDYCADRRFCSFESLLTTGDLFNVDFNYRVIPNRLVPFDYEGFKRYKGKAYAVVTNIRTGKAEYMQLTDMKKDMPILRASSSLPLISRNVPIGNGLYLDGGVRDCIPIRQSMRDGNRKNVVILTKAPSYRRQPDKLGIFYMLRYFRYPEVYRDMVLRRARTYNKTLDLIAKEEREGRAFVIRPTGDHAIGRVEKDPAKMDALYMEGYRAGLACYEDLMKFLNS